VLSSTTCNSLWIQTLFQNVVSSVSFWLAFFHSSRHNYVPQLWIIHQELGEQTLWHCGACSNLAKSITDTNGVFELMDCSAMIFMNGFSKFFKMFWCFVGAWPHLSSSTDTQLALKCEYYSKTTVRLKECSPKALQSISWLLVIDLPSFSQNLIPTRCLIPPSYQIKLNTMSKKHLCKNSNVHSVVSHCRLMQQPCGSVTLTSPPIFFHGGS
jgi:hypothetical protein